MAMLILNLLCAYVTMDFVHCILELYSIWQVSNFIKINILSVWAISNWCWQGTIIYIYIYLNSCAFFTTWQLGSSAVVCKSLTELLHWWGWNLHRVLWNYKPPVGFVKKQSPLVIVRLSSITVSFCLSIYGFAAIGEGFFYYY